MKEKENSTIREAVVLGLLITVIYEVQNGDGLGWNDTLTKFY
jgi:hypothetical protein